MSSRLTTDVEPATSKCHVDLIPSLPGLAGVDVELALACLTDVDRGARSVRP